MLACNCCAWRRNSVHSPLRLLSSYNGSRRYASLSPQLAQDVACDDELLGKKGSWMGLENQRRALEGIGQKLGVVQLSDWYNIPRKEINEAGGRRLFHYYHSLGELLKNVYPDYPWQLSRFREHTKVPRGHWQVNSNLMRALENAEKRLGITRVTDWYSVTVSDLKDLGFPKALTRNQFVDLLHQKYPDHKWEKVYLLRGKYGQQNRLERAVKLLFPNVEVKTNVRKEAGLLNPETGHYMELDLWIPSLNLGFEYQDIHHYKSTDYAFQPLGLYKAMDEKKKTLALQKGIQLIMIPCWWDGRIESMIATITKALPGIELNTTGYEAGEPIPEEIPPAFMQQQQKKYNVTGIGEPTTACFLTGVSVNPAKWWMFEKYDGVRGFWNPEQRAFYSRQGRQFQVPQSVVQSMPTDVFLDGEIWFGRGTFQEASKVAYRFGSATIDWNTFRYMVFDIPKHPGTYAERYAELVRRFGAKKDEEGAASSSFLMVAPYEECTDEGHLEKYFQQILDEGGEGVILRDPNTPYEPGRSRGYLKHKKFRDAEAQIVRSIGPYEWECRLPNDVLFRAGPGTAEFVNKSGSLKPGDIISFKHRGFLIGSLKPKNPEIYRIRSDLSWADVVNNFRENRPTVTALPFRRSSQLSTKKPRGYWSEPKNQREFFRKFAEEMKFDPLDPQKWATINLVQIKRKGGESLLGHFDDRLVDALKSAFPENAVHFVSKTEERWRKPESCREFFDDLAKREGFDPLQRTNWETVKWDKLKQESRKVRGIARCHDGIDAALAKAYNWQ